MKRLLIVVLALASISTYANSDYDKMMRCFDNLDVAHSTLSYSEDALIRSSELKNCQAQSVKETAKDIMDLTEQALNNVDGGIDEGSDCDFDQAKAKKALTAKFRSEQVFACAVKKAVLDHNHPSNTSLDHGFTILYKAVDSEFEFVGELMTE